MDLRIATAILIILSIFLYTTASNEHQTKHSRVLSHLNTHKRRKLIHKSLVQKTIDQNNSEKLKKHEEEIANNKINTTEENPQGTVEQTSNTKEENKVYQTKTNNQIEEPPIPNRKSESKIRKNEYIIEEEKKPLNETNKTIREVLFINGIHDILKLLANIGFAALDSQRLQNLTHKYISTETPKEEMNRTIGLRKLLRKGTLNQTRKTVLHQENIENKNISEHKQSSGYKINENKTKSKHVTTKESKKIVKQHKKSREKSVGGTNIKPKTIKKYVVVQNEDPASGEHLEVKENNSNKSQMIEVTEKYVINKTYNPNFYKNLKEVNVPIEDMNEINRISKSKTKIKKYIVTKVIDPSEFKHFTDDISAEDLSKYINSGENVEVEEHIYTKNEDSEPESIEKFIYIENEYPSSEKNSEKESVTNKLSRKNATNTPSGHEKETTKNFNMNIKKKSTVRKQFQEESKDKKSEDGSIKQNTEKAC